LVDEYQDINLVQKEFISLLKGEQNWLFVVGDEDQSIYGWRGADVRYILEFDREFPGATVHKLEENYRSLSSILNVANAVIANNKGRRGKNLWTSRQGGGKVAYNIFLTEREEAEHAVRQADLWLRNHGSNSEVAIFYRTNAQSRVIEEASMRLGVPYRVIGGVRFYERMEIKDTLAYIRFLHNPADTLSFRRVIKSPARGIGDKSVEKILLEAQNHQNNLHIAIASIASSNNALGKKLQPLADLLRRLNKILAEPSSLALRAEQIMVESGYLESLRSQNTEEAQTRIDNIYELLTAIDEFGKRFPEAGVGEFLQHVSLLSDIDQLDDQRRGIVLMTLHASKGLEFDQVFLTGMEEGLFPHQRSIDSYDAIEEERRLCYVGMTRARESLQLSSAASRKVYNNIEYHMPSRFLEEIPKDLLEVRQLNSFGFNTQVKVRRQSNSQTGNDDWW
jgi:DNA helicase-2/ATP-dependent DNA helicase PcrA